jgi:hypothetical protein
VDAPGITATATAVAISGGLVHNKKWTTRETNALLAGGALVLVMSFFTGTKLAPVVRGLAWLMLLTAILVSVPFGSRKAKK